MKILSAEFISSLVDPGKIKTQNKPEIAFAGRSNVGKSSLINMLLNKKKLAKTSSTPGKTQTINHFLINGSWYLVYLPGYGYAKAPKTERNAWKNMIKSYLKKANNLKAVFLLLDSRIPPQKTDLDFIDLLGELEMPFLIIFTKTDKKNKFKKGDASTHLKEVLSETWDSFPEMLYSSSSNLEGKEEILDVLEQLTATN